VILGAHLDSVDLATGASDNGAGVVVLLDVLTAVKALGLRPDRTLRVIFFSGEELEGIGSRAYVRAHAGDLAGVQAVLVLDKGGGRILGWPTMGQEAWVQQLAEAIAPAYTVGGSQIIPGQIRGSDHDPFLEAGVPAFFAYQEALDYWDVYHSDLDSLDHVKPENLVQAGQALAAAAWGFLQMDRRLPHLPAGKASAHP
jgi:Zn-dependent M28 family amino/carboxypeptidase